MISTKKWFYQIFLVIFLFSLAYSQKTTLTFKLPHQPHYKSVVLIGSFNHWDGHNDSLSLMGDSLWVLKKTLPVGYHYYRFLINNTNYLRDPANPYFGGEFSNSLIVVRPPDVPRVKIETPIWGSRITVNRMRVLLRIEETHQNFKPKKQLRLWLDGKPLKFKQKGHFIQTKNLELKDGPHWVHLVLRSLHYPFIWRDSVYFIINAADSLPIPGTSGFAIEPAREPFVLNGGLSYDPDWDPLPEPEWKTINSELTLEYPATFFPQVNLLDTVEQNCQFQLCLNNMCDSLNIFVRSFWKPKIQLKWKNTGGIPVTSVQVVGEFNHWKKGHIWMRPDNDSTQWHVEMALSPGQYEYKFIINDSLWIPDPDNPHQVPDGWNGLNSVLTVHNPFPYVTQWQWRLKPGWLQLFPLWGDKSGLQVEYIVDPSEYHADPNLLHLNRDTLLLRHWKLKHRPFWIHALIKNNRSQVIQKKTFMGVFRMGKLHLQDFNAAPEWTKSAIAYQIYLKQFGPDSLHSGTFQFLIQKLDYLQNLGINTIWLMPIMPSSTPHGYTPTNHFAVNPAYGTIKDFQRLIQELHKRGMRFIFDFVANHTGDQHPFFLSAWFNERSIFRDWYIWQGRWKYAYHNDWDALPNLNYANPNVRHYMLKVAAFWLNQGIDGFRCDAAWGVPHNFWKDFRRFVKSINTDVVLIDEVLPRDPAFHQEEFDMSYDTDFYGNLLDVFRQRKPVWSLKYGMQKTLLNYPPGIVDFRYLENQDLPRFIAQFGEAKTRIAAAFLLTVPGMPLIYYGQELGVTQNRPTMPWHKVGNTWFKLYRYLIHLRKTHPQLTSNQLTFVTIADTNRVLSYLRGSPKNAMLVGLNFSDQPASLDLSHFILKETLFQWPEGKENNPHLAPFGIVILKGAYHF